MPVTPIASCMTAGTSEGIELALTALAGPGDEVLVPVPTYPLYTAVLAKIGARPVFYRPSPTTAGCRTSSEIRPADHARRPARSSSSIRTIRPARAIPPRCGARCSQIADEHNIPLLADEVYADLAFDGPVDAIASLEPDAPVITFSSLSKAYLAPGWRSGWLAVGRTERLDDVLGRRSRSWRTAGCAAPAPMEYAIVAALNGDRSHQQAFRDALRERADADDARASTRSRACRSSRPTAAFYAMPKVALPPGMTDEDYVLALLRATGVLCVYGSGFGTQPGGRLLPRRVPRRRRRSWPTIYDLIGAASPASSCRGLTAAPWPAS